MSIKINELVEDGTADVYTRKGKLIGTIKTVLELNDVRVQIKKEGKTGYYILWYDETIEIGKDGRLSHWPQGFFDLIDHQLDALMA